MITGKLPGLHIAEGRPAVAGRLARGVDIPIGRENSAAGIVPHQPADLLRPAAGPDRRQGIALADGTAVPPHQSADLPRCAAGADGAGGVGIEDLSCIGTGKPADHGRSAAGGNRPGNADLGDAAVIAPGQQADIGGRIAAGDCGVEKDQIMHHAASADRAEQAKIAATRGIVDEKIADAVAGAVEAAGEWADRREAAGTPDIGRIGRRAEVDSAGQPVAGRRIQGHQLQLVRIADECAVFPGQHGPGPAIHHRPDAAAADTAGEAPTGGGIAGLGERRAAVERCGADYTSQTIGDRLPGGGRIPEIGGRRRRRPRPAL